MTFSISSGFALLSLLLCSVALVVVLAHSLKTHLIDTMHHKPTQISQNVTTEYTDLKKKSQNTLNTLQSTQKKLNSSKKQSSG